jgi:ATP-dependent HslUV protease ATP-binding subunit HslU
LDAGLMDDRRVEVDVEEGPGMAFTPVFSNQGMEEMGLNIQELFGGMMQGRKRARTVSVAEARELLTAEEARKLIDQDSVKREAVERAEQDGIIFIDEMDKIAGRDGGSGPDVSRGGVQRDILPIIEGSTVQTKYGSVRTDHILFVAAGAFHVSKPSDLIPELQGRLPIRVELDSLSEGDFRRILTEPESALTKQYVALLGTEERAGARMYRIQIAAGRDAESPGMVVQLLSPSWPYMGQRLFEVILQVPGRPFSSAMDWFAVG